MNFSFRTSFLTGHLVVSLLTPTAIAAKTNTPPLRHTFHTITTSNESNPGSGFSPAQIRHAYGIDTLNTTGKGQTIAIIDAYHTSHAIDDLKHFSNSFNLKIINKATSCTSKSATHPCFQQVASTSKEDLNWSIESDLDIEWAHAIAPEADILLIEASSSSVAALTAAVSKAKTLHPTVISMSWGGNEFSQETTYHSLFTSSTTTFVAASGDSGTGASFPASDSNVVSVGGTTLNLTVAGERRSEVAWTGSGGGISKYMPRPIYQPTNWPINAPRNRLIPDVAYNADPASGYAVYSEANGGWMTVGGTSAAAPQWAALLTLITHPSNVLTKLYTVANDPTISVFNDVSRGTNGTCRILCHARNGFDTVTGLGSPIVQNLLPKL